MENFIYILIGIAWVAYSLYSARQKAIQKQQSAGMPPSGPSQSSPLPIPGNQGGGKSIFDEILRELTGEPKPIPQVLQPAFNPVPPKLKNISEPNVDYKGQSNYKFVSSVPTDYTRNEPETTPQTHVFNEQYTNNESISKSFNLREAVIFSELLNPKYF